IKKTGAQMTHDEADKLLHAHIDGELDPPTTLEIETHLAENPPARVACERLRGLSAAIRDGADYRAAPVSLRVRVHAAIPVAPEKSAARPTWQGWLMSAGSLTAVADWLRPAASFAAVALVTWTV